MILAPVALFIYNRPWHTEQTLRALKNSKLADQTVLYVFCDGYKSKATIKEKESINEVRNLIKREQWCKEVCIVEREQNLGLAESVILGINNVFEKYEKVIVLEDDIVVSPYFLDFMNQGLELYVNEHKVYGVSGYKYPTSETINIKSFFLPIACSWGYATWKDRWQNVNFDAENLLNKISKKGLKKKMNFGGYPFYEMLEGQVAGQIDSWAIRFYASMFLENRFFLYPKVSLVENIGFDSSGTHCAEDHFFSNSKAANENFDILKEEVKLETRIVNITRREFEKNSGVGTAIKISNFKNRFKNKIKRLYNSISK